MSKQAATIIAVLMLSVLAASSVAAQQAVAVAVPARAGPVDGSTENSDAFVWSLFTQLAAPADKLKPSPVVFETWASDGDTFSTTPHWPSSLEPHQFHSSVLELLKTQPAGSRISAATLRASIDVPCKLPGNAAVGAFPATGSPTPCVAEETKRNRPMFDYIVGNNLNTRAGLAVAFAKSFKVEMPTDAIAVKGDWVPLQALLQWVPQLKNVEEVRKHYYTTIVQTTEYALVSLHLASRQNPNWVWGTFEHEMTPGRCDYIGCFDSFGAVKPAVLPNNRAVNMQYGSCGKTEPLKQMMRKENLSPVWDNYCLKSTEVNFTAADGTPYVLGNSVIEGIVGNGTVAASSCIACHAYASFGSSGEPTAAAKAMLPFNPTGNTIQGVLEGSLTFAFMWGVVLAP